MSDREATANHHAGELWSVFVDLAERQPDVEAILAPGRASLRFSDFPSRIEAVRRALHAAGIGRGDIVATALPNSADTAVCLVGLGCFATAVPLNPAYSEDEFDRYLRRILPKAVIVPEGSGGAARRAATSLGIPVVDLVASPGQPCGVFDLRASHPDSPASPGWSGAEDTAFILLTSGSTQRARLVPLRQRILLTYARSMQVDYRLGSTDRCILVMPLFHGHGLKSSLLNPLVVGSGVVCPDLFDVPAFFAWLECFRPTWYTAGFAIQRAIVDGLGPFRGRAPTAGLRFIRSASGRLDARIMRELEEAFGVPVLERYGMTETCTLAHNPLPPGIRKPGTVGLVAINEVRIVDSNGRCLAANEEGEVSAFGPTVVEGYWRDPEATAEAFVNGWFRTGDLGRFDDEGYLTITGRIKDLINRGGEKISPAEVESVLRNHPAVADVCVFPVPHQTLGQEVAAAVVLEASQELDEAELLGLARERLAAFKVPRKIVTVNEFPRTASGKLRRAEMAQLLGMGGAIANSRGTGERNGAPRTALEVAVGALWASMLGRPVDPGEDFFLIGGDSLSAITLLGQVQEAFGVKLPLAAILDEASTVAGMALWIERARRPVTRTASTSKIDDDAAPIPLRDTSVPCPVSFQQRRLWFHDRLHPGNCVYNLNSATSMTGPLDVEALRLALNRVVARHEALRTTFSTIDGEPCQVVASSLDIPLPMRDLRDIPPSEQDDVTRGVLDTEVHHPFDLERGPLLRAVLVRLADEAHTLIVVQHHIVTDAWSRAIFQRELSALYDECATGKDACLPVLPVQYPDYSAWQRRTLSGGRLDEMLAYWRNRLSGAPAAVALPTDLRRGNQREFVGSRLDRILPTSVFAAFFELARREKTSPYFAWLAAANVFLNRCSSDTDIVVGVPVQGRDRPETLGVLGFFVNMLPVRTDLSGDPSFRELLARVRKASAADLAHQHLPFERIVEDLQPGRRMGETPLFNTTCILLDDSTRSTRENWEHVFTEFDRGTTPFDLSLILNQTGNEYRLSFRYNSALFEVTTIERMMSHLVRLLESVVSDPDRAISETTLLTPDERDEIVVTWNRTDAAYPSDRSLQSLFEARVDASPDSIAISDGRRRLTYAELDQESNRLAHLLRGRGIAPHAVVGVCIERSIDLIVAIVAIVKAGGAYLPLDTKYPEGRRNFILENANAVALITRSAIVPMDAVSVSSVIYLESLECVAREPSTRLPSRTDADDLAYVIYTSGSTGQPKGVAVRQRGVSRLVINTNYLAFSPSTVIGQVSNVTFDAATFEIWGALLNGGRLEMLEDETILRADRLAQAIAERGVTALFLTTALFHQAAHAKPDAFRGLQTLLVGGEVADPAAFRRVLDAGGPSRLVHVYGPTETTTFASFHEVRNVPAEATSIPIGKPIANTRLYILGPHMQPEAVGIPGEIYIGGPGAARGYISLPELTSRRFLLDPFSDEPGAVLYRSGDLARYRADGSIDWIGRIDRQVKIRGFRVEPAEIEAALVRHPDVGEAAVVVVEDDNQSKRLVGYATRASGESVSDSDLRAFLKETLPDFMVPDSFVWLERLPLTLGGKIDRAALPHEATSAPRVVLAPRTPTERTVAAIWAEHLGVESVGVEDDFFDLGGHSLLAVKLITALELRFGLSLPLALLFEAPTVSALALAIDGRKAGAGSARVVNIQPQGRRTPIFALPGGGGSVIAYGLLARALGTSQPFYGLEHPGLDDGEVPPDRVEAVASGFLQDMQRLAPDKACVLIGACSGAIVAFELARLLEAAGRRVDRVIMLDPSRIGRRSGALTGSAWRRLVVPRFVAGRLVSYVREFSRLEGAARWEFVREKRARLAMLIRQPDPLRDSARDLSKDRVREATIAALHHYVPRPYNGSVALILGERFDSSEEGKSSSDWHTLCSGSLEVLRMPGMTSGEMLRPPLLEHLVRHLRGLLDHNVPGEGIPSITLMPTRVGTTRVRS